MSTPEPIEEWFKNNPWIYAVIGGVPAILILSVIILCISCFCYHRRKRRQREELEGRQALIGNGNDGGGYGSTAGYPPSQSSEPSVVEEMNRQRREQEKSDRNNAKSAVEYFVRSYYHSVEFAPLLDMGSRMQKYWFKVSPTAGGNDTLITIAPVSQRCPVKLDSSAEGSINKLLRQLRDHPYLHHIDGVYYLAEKSQLVICQPLVPTGSLKDVIYRATPTSDWSQKYSRRSKGLSPDKIALYGRQILEAIKFLYSKGFPPLGHVQSGNCFVSEADNSCRLAGYENTILGYKTRLFRLLKSHMDKIDVVMFGHLVFEMSCGYELTNLKPRETDFRNVSKREVREVLQYIFAEGFPHDINAILAHKFFSEVPIPAIEDTITISSDVKSLLKTVTKGKAVTKQPKNKKAPKVPPQGQPTTNPRLEEEPVQKPTPTPRQKKK